MLHSVVDMPAACSPEVIGPKTHMTEDMCEQLHLEIRLGFTNLTDRLVREIQTLSLNGSVRGSISRDNDTSAFSSEQQDAKQEIKLPENPFNNKSSDSLLSTPKANRLVQLRTAVVADIENHESSYRNYISSRILEIKKRSLKDSGAPDNCLVRLVLGKFFSVLSFLVIALNAVWMAYDNDTQIDQQQVSWHNWVNTIFTSWFIVELTLRLAALRMYFFFGSDWTFNMLDFALVLASIPEFFMHSVNLTYMRLIRLAKLTRALRLIRLVKFFNSLREILLSLFFTLGALFWSFVALGLTTYIFSLLFMQWFALQASDGVEYGIQVTENFKTTWNAMLSLFSMISGGQDWYAILQELDRQQDYVSKNGVVFYVFFTSFGLLNVIIAVFVGRAAESRDADQHLRIAREEEQRAKVTRNLIRIFNEIDAEQEGHISKKKFRAYFNKPKAQYMLQSHGLHLFDLDKMWDVMDAYDGSKDDLVDLPGFVMCMTRLSGSAKSTELVMMSRRVEQILVAIRKNQISFDKLREEFDNRLSRMSSEQRLESKDRFDRWSL